MSILKSVLKIVVLILVTFTEGVYSEATQELTVPDFASRPARMISPSIYKKMSSAQDSLIAENYDEAISVLKQLLGKGDRIQTFDQAKIYEMLSNASLAKTDYINAIHFAQRAVDLKVLSKEVEVQIYNRLIYMYYFIEDFNHAIDYLELWFSLDSAPPVKSYFSAAQIYAATNNMERALAYALKGVEVVRARPTNSEDPDGSSAVIELREPWLKLLIAIRLNKKDYADVVENLELAISLWPQRSEYYLQLSSVYQELRREREALAILSIAYQNSLVDKEADIHRLGQQFRYHNIPFKSAKLLSFELEREALKSSESSWEAIGNAWLQAREWQQGAFALRLAAEKSQKGILWLQLCQTSIQDEMWQQAKAYCGKAIEQGRLAEKEGSAHYLVALAYYYLQDYENALSLFGRCQSWSKTESVCKNWEGYVHQTMMEEAEAAEASRLIEEKRLNWQKNQQEIVDQAILKHT